jgi:hypothetical protein
MLSVPSTCPKFSWRRERETKFRGAVDVILVGVGFVTSGIWRFLAKLRELLPEGTKCDKDLLLLLS